LALVLQYVSGTFPDFLAKVLGISTSPFSWKHNFIFQFSQCDFMRLTKVLTRRLFAMVHLVVWLLWLQPWFSSHCFFSFLSLCP
jgi:hypothetical protein